MENITTLHSYRCDLTLGACEAEVPIPLMQQDALADTFRVAVCRDILPVDLTNMTVTGYLHLSATRQMISLEGTTDGHYASVTLTDDCYALPGWYSLAIQLRDGDVRHTVLKVDFAVKRTGSDSLFLPGSFPTLADLISRIEAVEKSGGHPGENGGYYTPSAQQIGDSLLRVSFASSKDGMPEIAPVDIVLPKGEKGEAGPAGNAGPMGDTGPIGATGATGQRGFSVLKITSGPSAYTTTTGSFTPAYRVSLSTVKSQAKATEVRVGDTVLYSYYTYPVGYVDSSYVYLGTRVSIRGSTGAAGEAGKTPVKGTDYFTETDKAAMVQEVIDTIGLTVIGEVDNANNILITMPLPDGTYTMRYENADGSTTEIGSFTVNDGGDEPVGPTYTNLADPTSTDWLTNKRINSSKNIVDVTESQRGDKTVVVTNMIPIAGVTNFHVKGLDILSDLVNGSSTQNYGRYYTYNSSGTLVSYQLAPSQAEVKQYFTTAEYDSTVTIVDVPGLVQYIGYSNQSHVRFGGILTGAATDVIITADQNIV